MRNKVIYQLFTCLLLFATCALLICCFLLAICYLILVTCYFLLAFCHLLLLANQAKKTKLASCPELGSAQPQLVYHFVIFVIVIG